MDNKESTRPKGWYWVTHSPVDELDGWYPAYWNHFKQTWYLNSQLSISYSEESEFFAHINEKQITYTMDDLVEYLKSK